MGIVDADECEIISHNSDRPFYLNLQFLLAPIVGLVILVCFVFEDICLSDVSSRTSEELGSGEKAEDIPSRDDEKKPKADVGRGDDDAREQGEPVEETMFAANKNSLNPGKGTQDQPGRIAHSENKLKKGGFSRKRNSGTKFPASHELSFQARLVHLFRWIYKLLVMGNTYEGPLRVTLVDEDGQSNCYHVRAELPLYELMQMHCGTQKPKSMILRQGGKRLDPGLTVAGAELKDLDVLDLESNYRKMYVECRLEADQNNRHLRQQLDLTHRDIHAQQGRLAQFERQMKLHVRCAKSNEQQARESQARLKRLTADIAALQKSQNAQGRTQRLLDRAAESLRARLEEVGARPGAKTKDSSWIQNIMGVARDEIQSMATKLTHVSERVAELEQKGSSASLVKELEDRVDELEKQIAAREVEVADWKEKWEASNRKAKEALKAVKAGKRAKKLEEEQQKVESTRQKDKYTQDVNALKQKLETQRRASEEQWKRLKEAKTQVERLKRKLSSQDEAKRAAEKDMESKNKDLHDSCVEWKSKAKSNARSLSESRMQLQQANKKVKELQKWKREKEDSLIPNLKRRVEELQKEVESWQSQARMYSEESEGLKQALATATQAQAEANGQSPSLTSLPGMNGTHSSGNSTIGSSTGGWRVPLSGSTNGISLTSTVRPIGSNLAWGSTTSRDRPGARSFVPSWDPLQPTTFHNGSSRWSSFESGGEATNSKSRGVNNTGEATGSLPVGTGVSKSKSKPTTGGGVWPLSSDDATNSYVSKDFKGTAPLVDRSKAIFPKQENGPLVDRNKPMFPKLSYAKPLVIVDDSHGVSSVKSPHTKS
eukprot:CAMPEP_0114525316 /NCGR_PEP_ID=MMETSP0109-20121206/22350_1 /TAXON_ID=29199 /ORGANISM="Chlorarachnion reptans, Strain CCCM449" /LENGTH=828 /DNA_ID=CAMNT_0001706871 /DNA_START=187 /DNA_END=2673 /DNA_ORIENTATION=-